MKDDLSKSPAIHGTWLSPEIAGMLIRAFRKNGAKQPQIPLAAPAPDPRVAGHRAGSQGSAAKLHLSYETVRDYLKRIDQKLQVRSRNEAVLRFLETDER